MASGSTTRLQLPYPLPTDPTNVPGDVEALANALDSSVTWEGEGLLSARPAEGTAGRAYYATDVPALYWDSGTTWQQVWPPTTAPALATYGETLISVAAAAGTCTLDLSQGRAFAVTLSGADTIAFTNVPATSGVRISISMSLLQDATGGRTASWPGSVDWGTAGAPTLSTGANKEDLVGMWTDNAGGKWVGFVGGTGY